MRVRRVAVYVGLGLLVALAAVSAYVRLAPSDPAVWHVDMGAPAFRPGGNWVQFCPEPGSRFDPGSTTVASHLARLDEIALATPRTTRLAGSPEEGRITWIVRSAIMGYPDFVTAQNIATQDSYRFCLVSRPRFGVFDFGVNHRRVRDWADQLLRLNEPPDLVPFQRP